MVKTVFKKTLNSKKIIQKGGAELICPSDIRRGDNQIINVLATIFNSPDPLTTEQIINMVTPLTPMEPEKNYTFALVSELGNGANISNKTGIDELKNFLETATETVDGKEVNAVSTSKLVVFLRSKKFISKFGATTPGVKATVEEIPGAKETTETLTIQDIDGKLNEVGFKKDQDFGNITLFKKGDVTLQVNAENKTVTNNDDYENNNNIVPFHSSHYKSLFFMFSTILNRLLVKNETDNIIPANIHTKMYMKIIKKVEPRLYIRSYP